MTPFQHFRKALGWREELLSYEECEVFGYVDDRGEDGAEVYDLLRLVMIDGVNIAVPIREADLDEWERKHIMDTAQAIVDRAREDYEPDYEEYD